jgi:hypothetical protein
MRVQFTFDMDDMVEVVHNGWARNPQVRRRRWMNLVLFPALCGIGGYVIDSGSLEHRVLTAAFAMIGATLYSWLTYKRSETKAIRRWLGGHMKPNEQYLCVVELTPESYICTQFDSQVITPWRTVTRVRETDDSVEIDAEHNAGVNVRKRAFSSPEEQQRFIALARSYMETSKHR